MRMQAVHARAAKCRERGRVHVDHPTGESSRDVSGNQLEVTGQDHEVDSMRRQQVIKGALMRHHLCRDARLRCALESAGTSLIGSHEHDVASARCAECTEVIDERLQVAAATAGEYCDARATHEGASSRSVTASSSVDTIGTRSASARAMSSSVVVRECTSAPRPPKVSAGMTSRARSPM